MPLPCCWMTAWFRDTLLSLTAMPLAEDRPMERSDPSSTSWCGCPPISTFNLAAIEAFQIDQTGPEEEAGGAFFSCLAEQAPSHPQDAFREAQSFRASQRIAARTRARAVICCQSIT